MRTLKTTAHSRQNEKERNTIVRPIRPSMASEGHSRHLDGFRPGLWVGVKHQVVQHCGGVVWSIEARILSMVAKTPNFSW